MALRARVNGQEIGSVPVDDRGLAYGDGLFETIAVHRANPLLLEAHLERLLFGCKVLKIDEPPGIDLLNNEISTLCDGVERGVVKLVVTRGDSHRGYDPTDVTQPRVIVMLHPWPDYAALRHIGMRVGMCDFLLAPQKQLARIKHLNRLEQVLARAEWRAQWQEALVRDQQARIVSGTQSNCFFIDEDEVLITPPIIDCGVAGIMRDAVIDGVRQLGIHCKEEVVRHTELSGFNQAFLTNSVLGVGPVHELCGRTLEIGPIIRRLQEYLYEQQMVVPD